MLPLSRRRLLALLLIPIAVLLVGWLVSDGGTSDDRSGSPIKSDERVVLIDTVAHLDPRTSRWVVPIHAWVFEPVESVVRREAIEQAIVAGLDRAIPEEARERFDRRVNAFLVDNERGKAVTVEIAPERFTLPESGANGHAEGTFSLEAGSARPGAVLPVTAWARDGRTFRGRVRLVEPEGLSVISDIDDTVKVTEVHDLDALITNTFVDEFRVVEGMPALYRAWHAAGIPIHYVSSSPWHLYESLAAFMDRVGLPRTSLHLKQVRLKDSSILDLFRPGSETKPEQIRPLLERFPGRRFILVGDSGEEDPEVYAALRAEFPDRIAAICIRLVAGSSRDDARFAALFGELPAGTWFLFEEPSELEGLLGTR